ncbi:MULTISPECIES: HD domain-containing phosphohydrolase [unclassified Paenibacillus]|uniref:HD-GYP domain-containing protein n=1 Tax=unclassified Paenibacillus TaxID=185978 RepID=UPI001AE54F95|nr:MULTISPECIES: HD domain-containing phosphohydrolase [unclassified Paenibacillus]MBP1155892.1 putative nucleotidyltransferase with HDIG domain [Paenibacillus sp. PvP091]MBP1168722.1 putative nucleotidyltransferase with HDIG domain [Paenibacillus sp. PvR098]MBP2439750.1 putative nucleotidyltransferase with HDIG domain [Paenibacillus sp. PvP052]
MIGNQAVNGLTQLLVKDIATYEHSIRIGKMAKLMAAYLNYDEQQTQKLIAGCCLHDMGKVHIHESILKKKSSLTQEEWKFMKRHAFFGVQMAIMEGITDQDIIDTIHYHHERWDGTGYPTGLQGTDIPLYARICSILDAFDSMISDLPYKKGMSIQHAREELIRQSYSQFDGRYVQVFLTIQDIILAYIQRDSVHSASYFARSVYHPEIMQQ